MAEGFSTIQYSIKEQKALFLMEIEKKYFSKSIVEIIFQFLNGMLFSCLYVFNDTKKRWCSFVIGLITVIIVTFFVSVMYNSILKAPMIFLKVAEDQNSEYDFQVTALFTNSSQNLLLNTTKFEEKLTPIISPQTYYKQEQNEIIKTRLKKYNPNEKKIVDGVAPRWMFLGQIASKYNQNVKLSAVMMLMDTEKEESLQIGRFWPYRSIGKGECHVKDSLLRGVGVRANRGEQITITISMTSMLGTLSGRSQQIEAGVDSSSTTSTTTAATNGTDLRTQLTNSGFDFNGVYTVNYTALADDPNVPPLQKQIYRAMGVQNVTGEQLYQAMAANQGTATPGTTTTATEVYLTFDCTVISSMDFNYGRFSGLIGNAIVLDSRRIMEVIGESVQANAALNLLLVAMGYSTQLQTMVSRNNIHEYAFQLVGKYTDRFTTYMKDSDGLRDDMAFVSNNIINCIGIDEPVTVEFPLVSMLLLTKFLSMFLDQIFLFVVVALAALGVILIFTLLLSKVEEKTYEYGMLRALGIGKFTLIETIFFNTLFFAIPGLVIGLLMSFIVNIFVELGFNFFVRMPWANLNYFLNWFSVLIAFGLGLGMPAITNIFPIRKALSKRLRDSLDKTHQASNDVNVSMKKLSDLGLEPWQASLAGILVVVGFTIYYVVPLSFIFEQYPLFFTCMSGILLAMILGMCLVSWLMEPCLEKTFVWLILWGPDRKMKSLIFKNMAGHRKRTRKTFMMFVISTAFIVGGGIVFSLQAKNIVSQYQVIVGSDVRITSMSISYPLPFKLKLKGMLENAKARGLVSGYTTLTFSMTKHTAFVNGLRLSNLAYYPSVSSNIRGIERNYLDVALSEFYLYTEFDRSLGYKYMWPSFKPDIIDSLYAHAGQAKLKNEQTGFVPSTIFTGLELQKTNNDTLSFTSTEKYNSYVDMIISSANKEAISANIGESPLQIRMGCYYIDSLGVARGKTEEFIGKTRAMIYKFPGFFYSSYSVAAGGSTSFVTFESYQKLLYQCAKDVKYPDNLLEQYKQVDTIKISDILIKINPKTSNTEKVDLLNEIRGELDPEFSMIQDCQDVLKTTEQTATWLLFLFNVTSVIAMILCFFVLFLSFSSNVKDNSWEFGVLRAVGLSVSKLIRSYIYEALALVCSGFLCGVIIGAIFAFSLSTELNLFLEMPFYFDFPYLLVVILGILSLICAVVGSYLPARVLRGKQIAFVLRGLD